MPTCFLSEECKKFGNKDHIRKAQDAETIAPVVNVTISAGGQTVTVGNRSSAVFNNKAVIKSFQYGADDGFGCRIEIVDEEGGAFQQAFTRMFGSLAEAKEKYGNITAEWGWVSSRCEPGPSLPTSLRHHFILLHIDVKFDAVYTFVLEGTDMLSGIADASRQNSTYGTDDNPMELKEAIKKMFANNNPPITNVKFLRRLPNGGTEPFTFKKNPKHKWKTDNQTAMAAARKWIRPFTTNKDKGIVISSDSRINEPNIIFWEDPNPKCDEPVEGLLTNVGTFIVNGGECSPVVEFHPRIHWPLAAVGQIGGNTDAKGSSRTWLSEVFPDCDMNAKGEGDHSTGIVTTNVVTESAIRTYGPKQACKETGINDQRHTRANQIYPSIEADLRIQGDPTLTNHIELRRSFVGVVVINPFHLDEGNCPEWSFSGSSLAQSTCHQVLSNKNWQILGVSHEIRAGSYTTTLKLFLAAPGGNMARLMPMGGMPGGFNLPQT